MISPVHSPQERIILSPRPQLASTQNALRALAARQISDAEITRLAWQLHELAQERELPSGSAIASDSIQNKPERWQTVSLLTPIQEISSATSPLMPEVEQKTAVLRLEYGVQSHETKKGVPIAILDKISEQLRRDDVSFSDDLIDNFISIARDASATFNPTAKLAKSAVQLRVNLSLQEDPILDSDLTNAFKGSLDSAHYTDLKALTRHFVSEYNLHHVDLPAPNEFILTEFPTTSAISSAIHDLYGIHSEMVHNSTAIHLTKTSTPPAKVHSALPFNELSEALVGDFKKTFRIVENQTISRPEIFRIGSDYDTNTPTIAGSAPDSPVTEHSI